MNPAHSEEPLPLGTVAIFRHQLFKRSEPFIADQAQQLLRFRPLYLGRERVSDSPTGADSASLSDVTAQRRFTSRVWQVLTRDPRPYLELIRDRKPRLVHAHFGVDAVYALPLARRLEVPLITTFHGYDATMSSAALLRSGKPAWWNYVLFRRAVAEHGTLFICISEYIRRRVIALGFPERRTRVHYMGVNTDEIRPSAQPAVRPTILHVARLVEKKGTRDLIEAVALVARVVPDVVLLIIGEGPLERTLRKLVQERDLGNVVHFLGAQSHARVLELMSQTWLFALPSVEARSGDAEGLGIVLLEAAACGIPAVANRHGGIPEVVLDGATGRLCAEHQIDELAGALTDLLKDDSLRRRMGNAARERAQRYFSLKKQSAALESIYQEVLGSAP